MSKIICALAICALAAFPSVAQAGTVTVTVRDGRVTIIADNATPREILAEWARVGEVRIVNGERVPGAPLTLRLEDVTERKALDVILRGAAGYMLASRETGAGPAYFDRIVILPTSNTAAAAATAAPRPAMPVPGRRPGTAPADNRMLGFAATPTEASPGETDPEPANLVPQAPVLNPYGQPQDPYAQPGANPNPQGVNPYVTDPSAADGHSESPVMQQAPALFPGSPAAPGGVVPAAPATGAAPVPGGGGGAARPGEMVQPPTQPTQYLNPYNIGARQPAGQEPQPAVRPGSSTTTPPRPPRQ